MTIYVPIQGSPEIESDLETKFDKIFDNRDEGYVRRPIDPKLGGYQSTNFVIAFDKDLIQEKGKKSFLSLWNNVKRLAEMKKLCFVDDHSCCGAQPFQSPSLQAVEEVLTRIDESGQLVAQEDLQTKKNKAQAAVNQLNQWFNVNPQLTITEVETNDIVGPYAIGQRIFIHESDYRDFDSDFLVAAICHEFAHLMSPSISLQYQRDSKWASRMHSHIDQLASFYLYALGDDPRMMLETRYFADYYGKNKGQTLELDSLQDWLPKIPQVATDYVAFYRGWQRGLAADQLESLARTLRFNLALSDDPLVNFYLFGSYSTRFSVNEALASIEEKTTRPPFPEAFIAALESRLAAQ